MATLYFERELVELKDKLAKLLDSSDTTTTKSLITKLKKEIVKKEKSTYQNLDAWQTTLVARHPKRPGTTDFIKTCISDFIELHGDRHYRNDKAITAGLGTLDGHKFMILGHVKGSNTTDNLKHNFGMANPEGYRKSLRLMQLAQKFNLPILTLIDTPGAYPGIGAEDRQQAESIAVCLREMGILKVPIISVVLGEGGSGGALALAVANRLLMLSNAVFGVISPEGCASILWDNPAKAKQASGMLKQTARDLKDLNIIEEIIDEPFSCAHNNPLLTLENVKAAIIRHYLVLSKLSPTQLLAQRQKKFRLIGRYK
ncbi:MAG: acetyl-CoA carboxylase carboxyltransferase subunit alpha [SAR324 cluster bacterium]|nr:acetyl-CoA carboxylase carboxyltransferase subunit alpha [SAR324 cluster bacterium]